jgi:transcriptional regulator with XRE-family HTH domain
MSYFQKKPELQEKAELLRRGLKRLGMTSLALASRISDYRANGSQLSPATVSRWMNGVSPMDGSLLMWIEEVLRRQQIEACIRTQSGQRLLDSVELLKLMNLEELLEMR